MTFDANQYPALLRTIVPGYEELGTLSFAYGQGSLVSGYTADADLDVVLVWEDAIPPQRAPLVAQLDEAGRSPPFVVDYEDIHLDRFVLAGQEYNVAHCLLADMEALVQAVRAGDTASRGVLDPLVAVSGLAYGVLLVDIGRGAELQHALFPFPQALRVELYRVAMVRAPSHLAELRRLARRGDWLPFHVTLVALCQTLLPALFAAHGVYYSGDKWLAPALARFGIGQHMQEAFVELWAPTASPGKRIAAAEALVQLLKASDQQ